MSRLVIVSTASGLSFKTESMIFEDFFGSSIAFLFTLTFTGIQKIDNI